jgi:hypothetical protein
MGVRVLFEDYTSKTKVEANDGSDSYSSAHEIPTKRASIYQPFDGCARGFAATPFYPPSDTEACTLLHNSSAINTQTRTIVAHRPLTPRHHLSRWVPHQGRNAAIGNVARSTVVM